MANMPESQRERLAQEQNEVWRRMQALMDGAAAEGRRMNTEESQNWEAANTRLNEIDEDLRRDGIMNDRSQVDRSQILDAGGAPPDGGDGDDGAEARAAEYREAFGRYLRRGIGGVTSRQRELLEANHQDLPEARAQGETSNAAGGFLVPPEFRNIIAETKLAYGGMLQYCNVITTESGANLSWPTNDDTMNEGQILAENTQIAEQDVTIGQRQIGAYTYTSKMVRVSWQLLNDAAFDVEGFLGRKFGERLGRIYARHLVSGTGTGQPTGVLTGLRVGTTSPTGATPTITFDNLVDIEHSIDPAYRESGNCRYGFADSVLKMLRKLKDADQRPLWQPIPAPGFPPTINGHPYFVDNSMAAPAVGGVAAIFGDFRAGMLVREVQGIQSVQLRERYADLLQSGFFAYSRMDAKPDDPLALAALKFGAAS